MKYGGWKCLACWIACPDTFWQGVQGEMWDSKVHDEHLVLTSEEPLNKVNTAWTKKKKLRNAAYI